jgi:hypothetical protein
LERNVKKQQLSGRARIYSAAVTNLTQAEGIKGKGVSVSRGARFLSFGIRLKDHRQIDKALKLAEPLASATRTPVVVAHRDAGLIMYQFQLATAWWQVYTRSDLTTTSEHVGVGLAEGRRQIDLLFDPPHIGVFGTTGSGKTETVKSMLAGLFTAHRPDDLQAVIVDLKGKYLEFANVAHLRGMPIARTESEVDRALSFVNSQIIGREQTSTFDSRRLLVVVDEAEAIFCNRRRLEIGEALVKRGREVRVNGLFATQEPHKGQFSKHIFKLVLGRWVGWVDSPNSSYHITGRGGLECHDLTGKGDFIQVKPGGLHDRLQVALNTQADYDNLPRADIAPPEFEEAEPLDVAQLPEPARGAGRPREEVDPWKIGFYLAFGPDNVSKKKAHDILGLGYDLHIRHRTFAETVVKARREILRQWKRKR